MRNITMPLALAAALLFVAQSHADATLKKALGLSMNQAAQVTQIQKKYRSPYRSKRGDFQTEDRKLTRARRATDSAAVAKQEPVVEALREQVRQIKLAKDEEIRSLLTPEQRVKFEAYVEQRRNMAGAKRDAKIFNF